MNNLTNHESHANLVLERVNNQNFNKLLSVVLREVKDTILLFNIIWNLKLWHMIPVASLSNLLIMIRPALVFMLISCWMIRKPWYFAEPVPSRSACEAVILYTKDDVFPTTKVLQWFWDLIVAYYYAGRTYCATFGAHYRYNAQRRYFAIISTRYTFRTTGTNTLLVTH